MRIVHTWHLLSASAFHVKLSTFPTLCSATSYLFEVVLFQFYVPCPGLCLSLPPSLHSKHTGDFISLHISFLSFTVSLAIYVFLIANPIYPIATLSGTESVQWLFIVLCPQNHRNLRWKRHDEVILSIPLANAELFPTV